MGATKSKAVARATSMSKAQIEKQSTQDSSNQPELMVKAITWQKDSHGLFDYEGKESERVHFSARNQGSFSLMRDQKTIQVKLNDEEDEKLDESKEEETPLQQIAKVIQNQGEFWIYHKATIDEDENEVEKAPENKLWNVVKACKVSESSQSKTKNIIASGYRLMLNDVIKLGRVRFKIKEIVSPAYQKRELKQLSKSPKAGIINNASDQLQLIPQHIEHEDASINIAPDLQITREEVPKPKEISPESKNALMIKRMSEASLNSAVPLCRICLSEETDLMFNPLFSPCKCAGTMKYIHLNCLQEWLNSRMITKETECTKTYYWKSLECELCKSNFPNYVKPPGSSDADKDISLHIVKYDRPVYSETEEPYYVVLESITNASGKVIHVINMQKTTEAKMGRGHDVDVRITDISVSRLHALIKKTQKGYFYVQDNRSKFGTLTLIRNPIHIKIGDPTFIQAGRTMLELLVRTPVKLLNSCLCIGQPKQKRKASTVRIGLATKNGIDFFPEEFIAINKSKSAKKDVDLELQTVRGEDMLVEGSETMRPMAEHLQDAHQTIQQEIQYLDQANSGSNNQRHNLELIPEDSLDIIANSRGVSILGADPSIQPLPDFFLMTNNLNQALIANNLQPFSNFQTLGIRVDDQNGDHSIIQIRHELEHSLSRLMEDHKSEDDIDNAVSQSKESANNKQENEQVFEGRSRVLSVTSPPKLLQNFQITPSVDNIHKNNSTFKNNLNSISQARFEDINQDSQFQEEIKSGGGMDSARNINTKPFILPAFRQSLNTLTSPTREGEQKRAKQKSPIRDGLGVAENSNLPTGRFNKVDSVTGVENNFTPRGFGFTGLYKPSTFLDNDELLKKQTSTQPDHSPNNILHLSATFLDEDRQLENSQIMPNMVMPSPFQDSYDKFSMINVQPRNQNTFLKASKVNVTSKVTPLESKFSITGGPVLGNGVQSYPVLPNNNSIDQTQQQLKSLEVKQIQSNTRNPINHVELENLKSI